MTDPNVFLSPEEWNAANAAPAGPTPVAAPKPALPAPWGRVALVYLIITFVIAAISSTVVFVLMLPIAFILVIIAVPYTSAVTVYLLWSRRTARRTLAATGEFTVNPVFADFNSWPQRLSLVNGAALGVLGLCFLIPTGLNMQVAAAIAAFSVVEILVNVRWLYGRGVAIAEEYAVRTRTHNWLLILVNRWVGWAIWWTGAVVAAHLLLGLRGGSISFPFTG